MWWREILGLPERLAYAGGGASRIDPSVTVEAGATLDDSLGAIVIGAGTRVCSGAVLRGPLVIGAEGLIGNNCMIRGPSLLGDDDEEPEDTKGRYRFPYGDFEKVHRCGLLAAVSRAGQRT